MGTNPYSMVCAPTELALRVLGGKWKTTILLTLLQGPCRYRDLRQVIPNLSDKVLTERLKALQAAGIVAREKSTCNAYFLTARGESLREVLAELYMWGNNYVGATRVEVDQPRT